MDSLPPRGLQQHSSQLPEQSQVYNGKSDWLPNTVAIKEVYHLPVHSMTLWGGGGMQITRN